MKIKVFFFQLFLVLVGIFAYLLPNEIDVGVEQCVLGLGALIGITAGASLLGNAFNWWSQDSANETNTANTAATNKLNYQMFKEAQDYNTKMYEDQKAYNQQLIQQFNDYNSPSSQMQRYRDAGINPYFALGNIDAGNAETAISPSAPTSPSQPTAMPAQVNPVSFDIGSVGRDIASVYSMYNSADLAGAQAENQRIQNIFAYDEKIVDLQMKIASGQLSVAQKKVADEQLLQMQKTRDYLIDQAKYESLSSRERKEQAVLDTKIKENEKQISDIITSWQGKMSQKQFDLVVTQISSLKATSYAQTQSALESIARQAGIKLQNSQLSQLTPLLVQNQKLQNEQLRLENTYGSNIWQAGGRWYERLKNRISRNASKFGFGNSSRW